MSKFDDIVAGWLVWVAVVVAGGIVALSVGGAALGLIFAEPFGSFALVAIMLVPGAARRIWAIAQRRADL